MFTLRGSRVYTTLIQHYIFQFFDLIAFLRPSPDVLHNRIKTRLQNIAQHNYNVCLLPLPLQVKAVNLSRKVWNSGGGKPPPPRVSYVSEEDARGRHPPVGSRHSDPGMTGGNRRPKKLTLIRNGQPNFRFVFLLNRNTSQTYEEFLNDVSQSFGCEISKVFKETGELVSRL